MWQSFDRVQCFGNRFDIFTVFVDQRLSPNEEKEMEKLLTVCKIFEYDVVISSFEDFSAVCEIGSKLEINNSKKYGTLGCFAERKDKSCFCALLSKHVAKQLEGSEIINISGQNIERKDLCFLIKGNDFKVDIAALIINDNLLDRLNFDCSFKTVDDVVKPWSMPRWDNYALLNNFRVFFRGASTPLGQGIVTSTDMTKKGGANCILVENDGRNSFCRPGDSGAIVCYYNEDSDETDKTIKTLAAVIGQLNPGFLLCVKLDFALDHLSSDGVTFHICDSHLPYL